MSVENMIRLATVAAVVTGGVQLRFDGEASARSKTYACAGGTPAVGARVCAAPISGTYIVLGTVGGSGSVSVGGWNALNACTFVSTDNPTGVIDITGDCRSDLKEGMRLKFDNGGYTICAIVTYINPALQSGKTRVTFLHEMGPGTNQALHLMVNSVITNPYYSTVKCPKGFPSEPDKWTITISDNQNRLTNSPTANTWYNAISGYIHPGAWRINTFGVGYEARAASGSTDIQLTLSTANNSESNAAYSDATGISNAVAIKISLKPKTNILSLTAKALYYLNYLTTTAGISTVGLAGTSAPSSITAECAYL